MNSYEHRYEHIATYKCWLCAKLNPHFCLFLLLFYINVFASPRNLREINEKPESRTIHFRGKFKITQADVELSFIHSFLFSSLRVCVLCNVMCAVYTNNILYYIELYLYLIQLYNTLIVKRFRYMVVCVCVCCVQDMVRYND
jgi:hypothetical protein